MPERELQMALFALADSRRLSIFKILLKENGECVSEIAELLGISVPAASQHLRTMESSEIVVKRRSGRRTCYEIRRSNLLVGSLLNLIEK